jgi:hypothetical protein
VSYRDPKRPKWLTRGSGCGCAVSILVVIGGYPWLFAKIWSCAHQVAGSIPCGRSDASIIAIGILLAAVAAFGLTKWAFDRGENHSHD